MHLEVTIVFLVFAFRGDEVLSALSAFRSDELLSAFRGDDIHLHLEVMSCTFVSDCSIICI